MKLYLELVDGDLKVNRVINVNEDDVSFTELNDIGDDMYDSLMTIKDDELKVESQRLTQHND